jgi:hypothetical protein
MRDRHPTREGRIAGLLQRALVLGFIFSACPEAVGGGGTGKGGEDESTAPARRIVWSFDLVSPGGRFDAREEVPLSRSGIGWEQLFGKDGDPKEPELYPRTPEALLSSSPEGGPRRRLELRTHGARLLVVSSLRPIPSLVDYTLRTRVDPTRLGRGKLRVSILFFSGDRGNSLDRECLEVSASDSPRDLQLFGEVPGGATEARLEILLAGEAEDAYSSARVESFELSLLPGIRIGLGPGRRLFFDEGERIEVNVAAHGLPRGPYLLSCSLSRYWLTPQPGVLSPAGAGGLTPEELKQVKEESCAGWAASGRPLRWVLFPGDSDEASPRPRAARGSLSPGGYRISLRVEDPAKSVCLEKALSFPVLPLATRTPRFFWHDLEGKLSDPACPRYLGAFRAEGPFLDSHPLAIHLFFFGGARRVGAVLFSAGSPVPAELGSRLGLSSSSDLLSES